MSILEAISPTAAELLKTANEPILAPEIELVAHRILGLYEQQRCYLADKPTPVLEELRHRCEEASLNENFSVRTAAKINFAACVVLLEARGIKTKKGAKR